MIVDKEVEDFSAFWPLGNQITDRDHTITHSQVDKLQQVVQLIKAAMNITDDYCARHGVGYARLWRARAAHQRRAYRSVKQVMYRVGIPVAQIGSNDVRTGGAQRLSINGCCHADSTHAGST